MSDEQKPKPIYCFDNGEEPFLAYYKRQNFEEYHNWGNRIEYVEFSEYNKLKKENEELRKMISLLIRLLEKFNEIEKIQESLSYQVIDSCVCGEINARNCPIHQI